MKKGDGKPDTPTPQAAPAKKTTHHEKLSACREAFGKRKQLAMNSGRVNDCSINKIAADVGIDKNWIHGHRLAKDQKINDGYKALRDDVNSFRESFDAKKSESEDKRRIKELEARYAALLESVQYRFTKADALEAKLARYVSIADQVDDKATQLLLKNVELEDRLSDRTAPQPTSTVISVKRTIISPDKYRMRNGKYVFGDEKVENHAWSNALNDLSEALGRKLPMRLYVLVGLPCSGKTTWANDIDSCVQTDRHPVIFDATNLTAVERVQLVQPFKAGRSDLPVVCVYFDTDMEIIRRRNSERDGIDSAKLDLERLNRLAGKAQKPDPYSESWIDELIVVRTYG